MTKAEEKRLKQLILENLAEDRLECERLSLDEALGIVSSPRLWDLKFLEIVKLLNG